MNWNSSPNFQYIVPFEQLKIRLMLLLINVCASKRAGVATHPNPTKMKILKNRVSNVNFIALRMHLFNDNANKCCHLLQCFRLVLAGN